MIPLLVRLELHFSPGILFSACLFLLVFTRFCSFSAPLRRRFYCFFILLFFNFLRDFSPEFLRFTDIKEHQFDLVII